MKNAMKTCRIGVVGAGTVGSGVIEALLSRADLLARRSGQRLELAGVAEVDRAKARAAGAPDALIVNDFSQLVENPQIDIIVELIGGTGVAGRVVRSALEAGKPVVTANKALLATQGPELFKLAEQKGVALAFEAAVAGAIPIIQSLCEGLLANRFTSLLGIVNGTCNYILTEMIDQGAPFERCLAEAQRLGYAEADPTFDTDGIDSGHKLALLSALAMESWVDFSALHIEGIRGIDLADIRFAQQLGYTVKLLAVARPEPQAGRIFLSVHPALLAEAHPLANVKGSMNAIALYGDMIKESMLYGRGAGREPTASAVIGDIVWAARNLSQGGSAPYWVPSWEPAYRLADMADYRTCYYLRLRVADRCGVFGRCATILGNHNVSLGRVIQQPAETGGVPVVILTHEAREGDVLAALREIGEADFMLGEPALLRIEG